MCVVVVHLFSLLYYFGWRGRSLFSSRQRIFGCLCTADPVSALLVTGGPFLELLPPSRHYYLHLCPRALPHCGSRKACFQGMRPAGRAHGSCWVRNTSAPRMILVPVVSPWDDTPVTHIMTGLIRCPLVAVFPCMNYLSTPLRVFLFIFPSKWPQSYLRVCFWE